MIDVVVPVYRSLNATRRCLESVIGASCAIPHEIVVIDDATPEGDLAAYLDELAAASRITLLRNEQNRGFVYSVNRGMALHGDRDVVLLNSDTEVANDWLDRLYRCAHGTTDIGTVTPWSNNATICSYPFEGWTGGMPGELGLAELDRLVARTLAGQTVELPTAVGFCMFIRRDCLRAVGFFDEARFGRGYGEENDFSCRAAEAGWRNVLAADVFVFHEGGVSFGDEARLRRDQAMAALLDAHPEYLNRIGDFSGRDPVSPLRAAIDRARLAVSRTERDCVAREARDRATSGSSGRPVQLHFTHSWDGGTNRWIGDFCWHDRARRNLVLRSVSNRDHACWRIELLEPAAGDLLLMHWDLEYPIAAVDISHAEYRALLGDVIRLFDVRALIVSSLIGHSLDSFEMDLPTVVVLHDLFPFCPAMFAYYGEACMDCHPDRLVSCMSSNPHNAFWHNTAAEHWMKVRQAYADRLEVANAMMVAPSEVAWARWRALVPEIAHRANRRIPHGVDQKMFCAQHGPIEAEGGAKLRIVVPGRLLPHKGLDLFSQVLPQLLENANVLLLGCGKFGRPFEDMPGVHTIATYRREDLRAHIEAFRPDCALLLSIVPESFSYTLSELFALGIPVIATKRGAFVERIRHGETGLLVDPDTRAIVEAIAELAKGRATLNAMRQRVSALPPRTVADMVEDYHKLLPLDDGRQSASSEPLPANATARWLTVLAERRTAAEREGQRGRAELDLARQRNAELEAAVSSLQQRCAGLEADVVQQIQHAEAVRRSRSWRITAPVRAVSTGARRLVSGAKYMSANAAESVKGTGPILPQSSESRPDLSGLRDRQSARFQLRERLCIPSSARVVVGNAGSASVGLFREFADIARDRCATSNDSFFVWVGRQMPESNDMDTALLQATRRFFVMLDEAELRDVIAGADVVVLDAEDPRSSELAEVAECYGVMRLRIDPTADVLGAAKFDYRCTLNPAMASEIRRVLAEWLDRDPKRMQ